MPAVRRFFARKLVRVGVVAAGCLTVAAVGASLAFARSTGKPLGSGVVVIETNLAYQGGAAAGTGMVLSSSGQILTNNHVVRGATTIKVVVPGTGHTYSAKVVGYDVKDDVAVLQTRGAPALKTVSLGNSSRLAVGAAVVARGNAGGTGTLTNAPGTVSGLNRTITVNDDQSGTETLTGLIETDAPLQPGDSGGPLYASGLKVVGMNTAAATGNGFRFDSATDAYAIPINHALAIARQITAGKASAAVHVGATAFIGVAVQPTSANPFQYGSTAGDVIVAVTPNSPAVAAGLVPGDVITAVAGHQVTSSTNIANVLLTKKPGNKVAVTYLDQSGVSHTTTVTLASGPPQ
jgi:S1-C subfamily serine protease